MKRIAGAPMNFTDAATGTNPFLSSVETPNPLRLVAKLGTGDWMLDRLTPPIQHLVSRFQLLLTAAALGFALRPLPSALASWRRA